MPVMPEDRIADRSRAIEAALLNIEKRFGKGSIMRLGERDVSDIPAISTTSLSLDAAIGVGGVPRGRIIEIYGPESSGKTTLALHIVAEANDTATTEIYTLSLQTLFRSRRGQRDQRQERQRNRDKKDEALLLRHRR